MPRNIDYSVLSNKDLYQKIFTILRSYILIIVISIVSLIIAKLIDAISIKFLIPKIPELFQPVKTGNRYFLPSMLFLAALFRSIFGFCTKFSVGYLAKIVARDLRSKLLTHMLLAPIGLFKQYTVGNLISKVNYDVEQITRALSDTILELLSSIVTIIALTGVMFSFSWHLTGLVLIIAPLISWFLREINQKIRKYSIRLQQSIGNVSHLTHEIIESCQIIRIFSAIPKEANRINNLVKDNFKQEVKINLVSGVSESIMLFSLGLVFVLLLCIVINQDFSIGTGEFVGLFGAMYGLIRPLKQLSQVNNVIARGVAGVESIFELLAMPIENYPTINNIHYLDNYNSIALVDQIRGNTASDPILDQKLQYPIAIKLHEVNFYYPNQRQDHHLVLSNLNIIFPAGKTTAIVGKSGSGKSTLISLLPKFYYVSSGGIYLNGININEIDLYTLRKKFSIVTQKIMLLNDTVANNIAYGSEMASKDLIVQAAKLANALEFIDQLPQGLETNIGNNGNLLSGGQRQRIAIARAIFKQAEILILDEATSALDLHSEQQIQASLSSLTKDRTTIIIAHRMSTIEQADQIVILDEGKVVAIGTHQELNSNQHYNSLYRNKFDLKN